VAEWVAAAGGDGGEIYLCLIESSLLHCSSSQQLFVSGGVWVGWVVLVVAGAGAAPATSNKSKSL